MMAIPKAYGDLMRRYGIDWTAPDRWENLAMALAKQYEPGFKAGRGRPPRWKGKAHLILLLSVEMEKLSDDRNEDAAALTEKEILKRLTCNAESLYHGSTVHGLQKQVEIARRGKIYGRPMQDVAVQMARDLIKAVERTNPTRS